MDSYDPDPDYTPTAVRIARPLITEFILAPECPPQHVWHARTTLPVLALFVSMCAEPSAAGLVWEALDPDALVHASLDTEPDELAFLRDLLDVSASFYAFLARRGVVSHARAQGLRARLATLALGMRPR